MTSSGVNESSTTECLHCGRGLLLPTGENYMCKFAVRVSVSELYKWYYKSLHVMYLNTFS